jgi:hypothetical protein
VTAAARRADVASRLTLVASALVGLCIAGKALVVVGVLRVFPAGAQTESLPVWRGWTSLGREDPSTQVTVFWKVLAPQAPGSVGQLHL